MPSSTRQVEKMSISSWKSGKTEQKKDVVFTVQDEGVGIPAKEQQRIFDRFYTGSNGRSGQSNGIGLALARELTALHHGSLTLESEPGKGSRFTVTLPWVAPSAALVQNRPEAQPVDAEISVPDVTAPEASSPVVQELSSEAGETENDRPSILLVDDNMQLLEMMEKILATKYRVLTAEKRVGGSETTQGTRRRPHRIGCHDAGHGRIRPVQEAQITTRNQPYPRHHADSQTERGRPSRLL